MNEQKGIKMRIAKERTIKKQKSRLNKSAALLLKRGQDWRLSQSHEKVYQMLCESRSRRRIYYLAPFVVPGTVNTNRG